MCLVMSGWGVSVGKVFSTSKSCAVPFRVAEVEGGQPCRGLLMS